MLTSSFSGLFQLCSCGPVGHLTPDYGWDHWQNGLAERAHPQGSAWVSKGKLCQLSHTCYVLGRAIRLGNYEEPVTMELNFMKGANKK